MILVPANRVEKIKYFSTLLGLIFIEITRGPLLYCVLRVRTIANTCLCVVCNLVSYFVTVSCRSKM